MLQHEAVLCFSSVVFPQMDAVAVTCLNWVEMFPSVKLQNCYVDQKMPPKS